MAQPTYSLDLTPSVSFPFGYLKQKLLAVHIPDRERLKGEIIRIFGEIRPVVLISVFEDWIKKLECVVQDGGSTITIKQKRREICSCLIEQKSLYELCDRPIYFPPFLRVQRKSGDPQKYD
jgi:hypothetical protein